MRRCAFCIKTLGGEDKVMLCGGCRRRAYSSETCQKLDWSRVGPGQGHKNWCELKCGEGDLDWKVQFISPEKGLGIVALRKLPKGFRIMVEKGLTLPLRHESHERNVMALEPKGASLQGKCQFNQLSCGDKQPSVLCLRLSRINHSCDPNSAHWYDTTYDVKVLSAVRDIEEREEICFSYIGFNDVSSNMSAEMSRMLLEGKWGIRCPYLCLCRRHNALKRIKEARELDRMIMVSRSDVIGNRRDSSS